MKIVMWDDDIIIQQILDADGTPAKNWEFHIDTDDIVMSYETIEDRFHNNLNLTTTTISDYIQQSIISGDQTPVFSHVYALVMGTREVIVSNHHVPEAMELIKRIKTDLCRIMNHRAIIKIFTEYEDLILSTTTNNSWQPFDI
jgi:hypothetical protein